ncbi:MAG: hypothetical protein HQ596_05140 [Candidatus Saganbacteria bacterium]|nr:hypothetical protein [Candidatus Saganbacteria bacterium]
MKKIIGLLLVSMFVMGLLSSASLGLPAGMDDVPDDIEDGINAMQSQAEADEILDVHMGESWEHQYFRRIGPSPINPPKKGQKMN